MSDNRIRPLSVPNTGMISFRNITPADSASPLGHLTPIEAEKDIPFPVRRVYYIYGVGPDQRRGFHSHRALQQVLIALGGPIRILVKTPGAEEVVELKNPWEGLYIGPYVWREMFDFSEHSTLLVLASEEYSEADYLRSYEDYEKEAVAFFQDNR